MGHEDLITLLCVHTYFHQYKSCYQQIINSGQHTHSLKPVRIATPTAHGRTMLYWYIQCVERWTVISFVYHSPSMCAFTLLRMCVHI